ncbi:MAG: MFS transporter [bacterium]
MSKQKIIVLLVALLDVLSIGVLIPALPDMIGWYHSSPELLTFGTTIYSLCAFFAAPLLGQRSDVHGRKNILILCVAGTALSFLVLIFTHSIWLYLLARAINGITGGNISILQAILTDISPTHQERAKNYGFLGAIF